MINPKISQNRQEQQDSYSQKIITGKLMKLTSEQSQDLNFPVGCPVRFYFDDCNKNNDDTKEGGNKTDDDDGISDLYGQDIDDLIEGKAGSKGVSQETDKDNKQGEEKHGESFLVGIVSAVFMDFKQSLEIVYQVTVTGGSQGESSATYILKEKELAYSESSPVFVSTTSDTPDFEKEGDLLKGKIIQCSTISKKQQRESSTQKQHEKKKQTTIQQVNQIKDTLQNIQNKLFSEKKSSDDESTNEILHTLGRLCDISIDHFITEETGIEKQVSELKHYQDATVAKFAEVMLAKWELNANDSKESMDKSTTVPAKSEEPFYYTIVVMQKGNKFHVIEDVPSSRVKWRKVAIPSSAEKTTAAIDSNGMEAAKTTNEKDISPSKPTVCSTNEKCSGKEIGKNTRIPPPSPSTLTNTDLPDSATQQDQNVGGHHAAEIDAFRQRQIKFTPPNPKPHNVTVTSSSIVGAKRPSSSIDHSRDDHYGPNTKHHRSEGSSASAQKADYYGSKHSADTGNSFFCRVKFPLWLWNDSSSKDRLFFFLKDRLDTFSMRYNCLVVVAEDKEPRSRLCHTTHIYIKANENSINDRDNVVMTKEAIEDSLIEYVKRDGCIGRLFYDCALFCRILHQRSATQEIPCAVRQRTPFNEERTKGWISIVELPCERHPQTGRKMYHGEFILRRENGILSEISQKTGCTIKLCGDEFRVPVKIGRPYVWVWGNKDSDVDLAVEILKRAIGYHMRNCDCHWG